MLAPDVLEANARDATYSFTIYYSDDSAIDVSTIDVSDVAVTDLGGYFALVTAGEEATGTKA